MTRPHDAPGPPSIAIGVDVGGSGVRAALVASDGSLMSDVASIAWHGSTATIDTISTSIVSVIQDIQPRDTEPAVGLALPGFIDSSGLFCHAPNLPAMSGLNPVGVLRDGGIGTTIVPIPDIAAATVADARTSHNHMVERLLCVAIGTGINAGLAISGRLVETVFGCLGDAGHVPVFPSGPTCACGAVGCVEATASGAALARAGEVFGFASARAVSQAAESGDQSALALLDEAGTTLGRGIAVWSALTFPDRVSITGGVAAAGELLMEPARKELGRLRTSSVVGKIELVASALGSGATLLGAGILAIEAAEGQRRK